MSKKRPQQTPETTSPAWRIIAIALAAGSVAAAGFYAQEIDRARDFATIIVVTIAGAIAYWADKRPDRLRMRLGPFAKIATAIRDSRSEIQSYVHRKPLRVGVALAALRGVALVVAANLVVGLMGGLYSWHLAVAVGAGVAAVAAAPHLFTGLVERLTLDDEDEDPGPGSGQPVKPGPDSGSDPRRREVAEEEDLENPRE